MLATVAAAVGAAAEPLAPWFSLVTGPLATMIPSAPAETAAAFALSVDAVMWTPVRAAGLLYLLLCRTPLRAVLRPRTAAQPPKRKE